MVTLSWAGLAIVCFLLFFAGALAYYLCCSFVWNAVRSCPICERNEPLL